MRLLLLGGTRFLGRHLVEMALARGHAVTLVNRGISGSDLFPEAERLLVDRSREELPLSSGRCWDAAIDVPTDQPDWVGRAVRRLEGCVEHFAFVSSLSAYADFSRPGITEDEPLAECLPTELQEPPHYGARKAVCERIAQGAFGDRCLVVRPGLLVGPHDPSDRFTYWPRRLASEERALAPGDGRSPVQFLDVRDLAHWLLDLLERRVAGVFNAVGPAEPLSMAEFLDQCRKVTGVPTPLHWIDEEAMERFGIRPWIDLPVYVGSGSRGMLTVDNSRALSAGLECRPVPETILDTLVWDRSRSLDGPRAAGLDRGREREVLAQLCSPPASVTPPPVPP